MRSMTTVALATVVLAASASTALAQYGASAVESGQLRPPDVPYVPTPPKVVDAMLELAQVKKGEVVYDLGCGDGRIVIQAAKRHGARGVGIDIDPDRVDEARKKAKEAGVADRVKFTQQDLFETDFREANVVALYLLQSLNLKLRPLLLEQLKPGSRIVSHAFDMGSWEPDQTVHVDGYTAYLWIVPEKVPPELKQAASQ